jgi:hypothetical protein
MKKRFLFILLPFFITSASSQNTPLSKVKMVLNSWHKAAAEADFNSYFNAMTDDAVFIGTDPKENWNKPAFMAYAKPFFDKGKAWSFTTIERHIYFNSNNTIAWFDELLNTQMKICRGSGVLVLQNGKWKIQHYVLSMTIPNEVSDEVIKIKSPIEEPLISILENKK